MEITEEEKKLLASFRQLGVQPKADTKEDLQAWIQEYATSASAAVKQETPSQSLQPATTLLQAPRLSCFTGNNTKKDTEASYDLWRYEVECLRASGTHNEQAVLEAARRSLRGEAARIAMRLGTHSTLENLLTKFGSVYGATQSKESILAQFYSARQQKGEDVSSWSCRLEDLLMRAEELGQVDPGKRGEMLRCMLWTGLLPDLKDRSGYKFDTVKDFDKLRTELRRIEQESVQRTEQTSKTKTSAMSNMASTSDEQDDKSRIQALEGAVQKLTDELKKLQKQRDPAGVRGQQQFKNAGPSGQQTQASGQPGRRKQGDGPVCYRCGEKGHIRAGCKVRLDHSAKREKELSKRERLGIVRNAENQSIVIKPNSTRVIRGVVDKGLDVSSTCAMLQPTRTPGNSVTSLLDITPTLVNYQPVTLACQQEQAQAKCDTADSESFMDKVKISSDILSEEEVQRLELLLNKYQDGFSKGDLDVGYTSRVRHEIKLTDDTPFKQRHRHIPPGMFNQVREHLQQLLDSGIIRRSHSPFSSNVVLVKKKDGALRLCIDFRQLNARTLKDSYALPRIEELLDALAGSKYFSVLDMKSGYHQIEVAEEHKERTAFTVAPLGFFEYNRMAMGLANAPATYQRLMEECLGDLHLRVCLVFLDDIIIFSDTFEEHLERIEQVLHRLREWGLKLNPKKCSFGQERVKYVGHIVSASGVEADPEKCEKIRNWPTPQTPEEIRQFLGFAGYYRRFVRGFSQIARPLMELMPAPTKTKQRRGRKRASEATTGKWVWGKEQEAAFAKLKECLSSPPVLGFPDYSSPFEVHTDACQQGLGAVLYQIQDARLDATGHRWLAALAAFDFDIIYRPGKNNADADALSRLPVVDDSFQLPGQTLEQLSTDDLRSAQKADPVLRMSADVDSWITKCPRCIRRKTPANSRAPLVNVVTTQPLELVCTDFLTLETSKGGFQHVLVITDHFTRYALAVPTRNMSAKTTADVLFNQFVVHYGMPKRLHSDQGANFEGRIIRELCQLMECQKSRTTPYHPMGNGMCERFNRTLLDMLGTLAPHQKHDWKSHIATLVHAYNCTRHESTGFSPFSLMFGRDPRLPVDLVFGLGQTADSVPLSKYVENLRSRLRSSYELATAAADKARAQQKKGYDRKTRGAGIEVGDRVLVKIVVFDGKHKIADKWEEDVYELVPDWSKNLSETAPGSSKIQENGADVHETGGDFLVLI
nr:hypothetical protein BaRGS_011251 [Batillaria attramentaria]